jgi:hypothetical protein
LKENIIIQRNIIIERKYYNSKKILLLKKYYNSKKILLLKENTVIQRKYYY